MIKPPQKTDYLFPQQPLPTHESTEPKQEISHEGSIDRQISLDSHPQSEQIEQKSLQLPVQSPETLNLQTLTSTDFYNNATVSQAALLETICDHIAEHERWTQQNYAALYNLCTSEFFENLNDHQRTQLLTICAHTSVNSLLHVKQYNLVVGDNHAIGRGVLLPLEALCELSQQQLHGQSRLLSCDSEGTSLLENLYTFSLSKPDKIFTQQCQASMDQTLGGLILEINDPGQISQGNVGTCTVTSMQIVLIKQNPAEYARICKDLVVLGESTLQNGDALPREPSSVRATPGNCRTPTERLFQSALMEYGTVGEYNVFVSTPQTGLEVFDASRRPFILNFPPWLQLLSWLLVIPGILASLWRPWTKGLSTSESRRVAQGLFGKPFYHNNQMAYNTATTSHWAVSMLKRLETYQPDGGFSDSEVFITMMITSPEEYGGGTTGHQLQLLAIEDDRVILHDPYGSENYYDQLKYAFADNPTVLENLAVNRRKPGDPVLWQGGNATWEDPHAGIIAIQKDIFLERFQGAIYPVEITEQ